MKEMMRRSGSKRRQSGNFRTGQESLYPTLNEIDSIVDVEYKNGKSVQQSHKSDRIRSDYARSRLKSSESFQSDSEDVPAAPGDKSRLIPVCYLAFFVLIILIALYESGYLRTASYRKKTSPLKRYNHEVFNILKKNFTREYQYDNNTKAVLRLVGEKWVEQEPKEPYVVLIAGTKANVLVDALVPVFSDIKGSGIDKIFCNEHKERQLLDTEIRHSLLKPSKAVILHGIHKLRGNAPLCLHSLSDPDHSPFPSALILLTIDVSLGTHPACEDEISSYLLNAWKSNFINEDQIRPILSRISSYVICMRD